MEELQQDKQTQKALDKALMAEMSVNKEELKRLKKKLLKAEGKPERGIETWFRLSSKSLYTRLQIVDTKANILITANAIIISVVLGSLYPRLDTDPHMIYAVSGIVLTNIFSITYAILATIPKITGKKRNANNLLAKDLMTFDDFHHMSIDDYQSSVLLVLERGDTLYPSIITDIHKLGVTLADKYRLIRISYLVFLYGMILSVFAFALCHAIF
jgi:hypothetical protein